MFLNTSLKFNLESENDAIQIRNLLFQRLIFELFSVCMQNNRVTWGTCTNQTKQPQIKLNSQPWCFNHCSSTVRLPKGHLLLGRTAFARALQKGWSRIPRMLAKRLVQLKHSHSEDVFVAEKFQVEMLSDFQNSYSAILKRVFWRDTIKPLWWLVGFLPWTVINLTMHKSIPQFIGCLQRDLTTRFLEKWSESWESNQIPGIVWDWGDLFPKKIFKSTCLLFSVFML